MEKQIDHCPHCDERLGASTCIDSNPKLQPGPGDLSLCYYCSEIMIHDEDNNPRKVVKEDLEELDEETLELLSTAQDQLRSNDED